MIWTEVCFDRIWTEVRFDRKVQKLLYTRFGQKFVSTEFGPKFVSTGKYKSYFTQDLDRSSFRQKSHRCTSFGTLYLLTAILFPFGSAIPTLAGWGFLTSTFWNIALLTHFLHEKFKKTFASFNCNNSIAEHVEDAKSIWSGLKTFFFLIFCAIAIVAFAIFGIAMYQKHKEKSRKRFY